MRSLGGPAFQFAAALLGDADTAQDIVQEAFVRAWQSKRTPREPQPFRSWLYKIIVNQVRDERRRRRRWAQIRFWVPDAAVADPELEAERRTGNGELTRALARLSPREREAVYLHFFEDSSYDEVARILDLAESTARVLVHRALRKLRGSLRSTGWPGAEMDL